jgi:hypothetical protein
MFETLKKAFQRVLLKKEGPYFFLGSLPAFFKDDLELGFFGFFFSLRC